jgi:serine/threonine protein phosphatase 1
LEDKIKISKSDELYFLGDIIDRGKHSKQVLDFLDRFGNPQGYQIKPIKGNHEEYFISAMKVN